MVKIALRCLASLFQFLLIALLAVTISRLLLYFFNVGYFKDLEWKGFVNILWHGLRFDLSALAAFQAPFLLLFFVPFSKRLHKLKETLLLFLFGLSNFFLILLNSIDSVYFRFTLKRSTADLFSFITTGNDTIRLLPQFLKDYWYIPIIVILLLWTTIRLYRKIKLPLIPEEPLYKIIAMHLILLLFTTGLAVLAIRGGFQLKPIRNLQAAEVVGVNYAPLVLNTPFTIMKTLNKKSLEQKTYFDQKTLRRFFNPVVDFPKGDQSGKAVNVVIIIMESFSKEYMAPPFGLEGKTPFLDSLAKEGLFFDRAFANGKKSIDGIPAILAGIPSLMEDPYITSVYSTNNIKTLASILGDDGYTTSFFHGGTTGTMGFDAFSRLAGFNYYFGMENFSGPESYDGNWGIFDEPFFQFFGEELNKTPEPFFSTFFSLSSHHPYTLPEKYKKRFSGDKHPLLNTVAYADMALEKFFGQIKSMPWYNNTLFIITADHTGQSLNSSYATQLGSFAVPVLFYAPGDSTLKGRSENVFQHVDIQPSILGYLNHNSPFFSFGKNKLDIKDDSTSGFALNYLNNIYQFIQGDYVLHFNGDESIAFYNYKTDSLLQNPLKIEVEEQRRKQMENTCKAIIQTYNNALINNAQSLEGTFYSNTNRHLENEN